MTKHSNVIDELLDEFAEAAAADDDFEHDPARGLENYQFAKKEAKATLATELVRILEEALGEDYVFERAKEDYLPNVYQFLKGKNELRQETRTRLTAIIERELS